MNIFGDEIDEAKTEEEYLIMLQAVKSEPTQEEIDDEIKYGKIIAEFHDEQGRLTRVIRHKDQFTDYKKIIEETEQFADNLPDEDKNVDHSELMQFLTERQQTLQNRLDRIQRGDLNEEEQKILKEIAENEEKLRLLEKPDVGIHPLTDDDKNEIKLLQRLEELDDEMTRVISEDKNDVDRTIKEIYKEMEDIDKQLGTIDEKRKEEDKKGSVHKITAPERPLRKIIRTYYRKINGAKSDQVGYFGYTKQKPLEYEEKDRRSIQSAKKSLQGYEEQRNRGKLYTEKVDELKKRIQDLKERLNKLRTENADYESGQDIQQEIEDTDEKLRLVEERQKRDELKKILSQDTKQDIPDDFKTPDRKTKPKPDFDKSSKRLKELEEEHERLIHELDDQDILYREIEELKKQLRDNEALQFEIDRLGMELKAYEENYRLREEEISRLHNLLENQNADLKRQDEDYRLINELEEKINNLNSIIDRNNADIDALKQQRANLLSQINTLRQDAIEDKKQSDKYLNTINELKTELKQASDLIAEKQRAINQLVAERDGLSNRIDELARLNNEQQENNLNQQYDDRRKINALIGEIRDLRTENKRLHAVIESRDADIDHLVANRNKLIAEMGDELYQLKEEIEYLRELNKKLMNKLTAGKSDGKYYDDHKVDELFIDTAVGHDVPEFVLDKLTDLIFYNFLHGMKKKKKKQWIKEHINDVAYRGLNKKEKLKKMETDYKTYLSISNLY
mgnify:CR=1 FL=1